MPIRNEHASFSMRRHNEQMEVVVRVLEAILADNKR